MNAPNYQDGSIEQIQSAHRRAIVEAWGIQPGMRVIEIGCGQGDLTLALAEAVGPTGFVMGLDVASPDYGSPLTLGEATKAISDGPYGPRVEFRLGTDLRELEPRPFDFIVIAHASWYFQSRDQLVETLRAAKAFAPRLGFAEWDVLPTTPAQLGHLFAVFLQAGAGGEDSNVRTLLTRSQLASVLEEAGWKIDSSATLDSSAMQDADWEIGAARRRTELSPVEAAMHGLMLEASLPRGNASLGTLIFVAT